jgi:CIC family chloride channel protein
MLAGAPPAPAGESHMFQGTGHPSNRCLFLILSALEGLVSGLADSPAHSKALFVNVPQKLKVQDLKDRPVLPCLISQTMTMARFKEHCFPVVEANERMVGTFAVNGGRASLFEPGLDSLVAMAELDTTDVRSATLGEDPSTVRSKVAVKNIDSIPVVRKDDPSVVPGMFSRRTIIDFYNVGPARLRQRRDQG